MYVDVKYTAGGGKRVRALFYFAQNDVPQLKGKTKGKENERKRRHPEVCIVRTPFWRVKKRQSLSVVTKAKVNIFCAVPSLCFPKTMNYIFMAFLAGKNEA